LTGSSPIFILWRLVVVAAIPEYLRQQQLTVGFLRSKTMQ
jgi:hypothetical protein